MSSTLHSIPSIKLLVPAIISIIVSTYIAPIPIPLLLSLIGVLIMLVSYIIPEKQEFRLRWLFGLGSAIFVFFIFSHINQTKQEELKHQFSDTPKSYIGIINNIPQEKNKTFACNIGITHPIKKNIVLYIQKDTLSATLTPGMEIVFHATLKPFKNFGNPDDFDYANFMNRKGFTGTAYTSSANWQHTKNTKHNIETYALKLRQKVLNLYRDFELNNDAFSFISALTLGDKQDLTIELKEAFRASGTSHVLAVSGLHVGIVYIVISFIFSFLGKKGTKMQVKQLLVILSLWSYALLTGMSPSIIRATIMLTIIATSTVLDKDTFSYNTLCVTAFIILIFKPSNLFDIGFQMSFGAVLAILFFNPKINRAYLPKNKIIRYLWDLFTVSLSAQLGVFPITLYYFGTFPTYFFISNIIIVPLIGLIIYTTLLLLLAMLLKSTGFSIMIKFFAILQSFLKLLTGIAVKTVYFIEALPLSEITNKSTTTLQLFLILYLMYTIFIFFERKRANHLIIVLSCALMLISTKIVHKTNQKNDKLVIFNTPNQSDIGFFINNSRAYCPITKNNFLPIKNKRILLLTQHISCSTTIENKIKTDIIILSEDDSFSITQLNNLFLINTIVLDNTLPEYKKQRWQRECTQLGITTHDISQYGAFMVTL